MEKFKQVIIEVSAVCNLKCVMCPTLSYKNGFGIIDDYIFNKIINEIDSVASITLDGWGEPLLDPKIFEKVRTAKAKADKVGFTSNATLFDNYNSKNIVNSGIDYMTLSIDGGSKEVFERVRKGAEFSKVINNIKMLVNSGLDITLTMTLSKLNFNDVNNLLNQMELIGVRRLVLKPANVVSSIKVHRLSLNKQQLQSVFSEAKDHVEKNKLNIDLISWDIFDECKPKNNCLANSTETIYVGFNGEISPCCNLGHHVPRVDGYFKKKNDTYVSFGSIVKKNIYEIWFSEEYVIFRNELKNNNRPSICEFCRIY